MMRHSTGMAALLAAALVLSVNTSATAEPARGWIVVAREHLADLFDRRLHFEGGFVRIAPDGHLEGRRGPGMLRGHWAGARGGFCPRIEGRDGVAPDGCDVWHVETACLASVPGAPCNLRVISKGTKGRAEVDWGWGAGLGFILP